MSDRPADQPEPEITLIHVWFFEGVWRAEASNANASGHGQATTRPDAVDAAVKSLKIGQLH